MNFVIIGNSWDAGRDNPTSKHQIALKLGEKGHRVLWVDGAGMRRPSLGSGGDRAKMVLKLRRGLKPAYKVEENIWRISPLILPFPGLGAVRWMNERIYLAAIRRAVRRIGLVNPVLINFLPSIPGVIGAWRGRSLARAAITALKHTESTNGEGGERREDVSRPASPPRAPELAEGERRGGDADLAEEASSGRVAQGVREVERVGEALPSCPSRPSCEESVPVSVASFNSTNNQQLSTIYYCVDRWDQFGAYDSGLMARLDAECCRNADAVIASAQDLYERCRRHNENCYLIPHGVDWGHFARALGEENFNHGLTPMNTDGRMGNGEGRKIDHRHQTIDYRQNNKAPESAAAPCSAAALRLVGFFGLISEWVDQDLLVALAKKIDNCELVLAGKADVNTDRLAGIQNIRMIGSVPYAELPGLVGSFEAGIIPFKVNELTRAVNPIKLREMLAAGCPVVSTALPEVEKLAREMPEGAVRVAGSNDEFVRLVSEQLDHPLSHEDRKRISDAVKDQDWSSKVDEILEMIGGGRP